MKKSHLLFIVAVSMLIVFLIVKIASGRPITFQWDPNPPEDQVEGYTLIFGPIAEPEKYNVTVPGDTTTVTVHIPVGIEFRFGVKAFNKEAISEFSNFIEHTAPPYKPPPDNVLSEKGGPNKIIIRVIK